MSKKYDVIIIGAGPAGVSAAIYLKRFNREVLVIGNSNSSLHLASSIDNYYGVEAISGKELYEKGIVQLKTLEIDYLESNVLGVDYFGEFAVKLENSMPSAKNLILATGKARNKLKIKNYQQYEMKGISYCAVCDGFFYRKKKIGIIGSGKYMEHELAFLSQFTDDITIFTNGEGSVESNYRVVDEKILSFYGNDVLEGIETVNNKYSLDGVFVAIGQMGTFDLVKHLGINIDKQNNIVVNEDYQTNLNGLYAIGDAVGGVLQVTKASYDGMMVAYSINKKLRER